MERITAPRMRPYRGLFTTNAKEPNARPPPIAKRAVAKCRARRNLRFLGIALSARRPLVSSRTPDTTTYSPKSCQTGPRTYMTMTRRIKPVNPPKNLASIGGACHSVMLASVYPPICSRTPTLWTVLILSPRNDFIWVGRFLNQVARM